MRTVLLCCLTLTLTACDRPTSAAESAPATPAADTTAAPEAPEPSAAPAEAAPAPVADLAALKQQGSVNEIVEKVDLPSHDKDGTPIITFEMLSAFRYPRFLEEGEEAPTEDRIPDAIKALDGHEVIVSGYMMPTKLRNGRVEKFMLVPNTLACCFGKPLELNEWVNVDMTDNPTDAVPDVRIAVRGRIQVGENKIDGWVMDLYRMQADRVRIQGGF